jgi:FtsP/CotA-like multicopper oxidase with cupredoxin domain
MLSRRRLLSTGIRTLGLGYLAAARAVAAQRVPDHQEPSRPADVTLHIANISHEVARNRTYRTKAYNGAVPGPLIRLPEGVRAGVHIINATDTPEYVHWHGLSVPTEIDGTEEEGSLVVPAHGELRYSLTPRPSGTRYVHSHAMSGMHLNSGTYSGQFGFVYIEPEQDKGRFDQEVFLATHEWGPELVWQPEDDDGDIQPPGRHLTAAGNWEVEYEIGSINGKALGHGEPIRVKPGRRVLFHLLNASATATVKLALAGHKFLVIGMDGNPVPTPRWADTIELGTAERVDAIVVMNNPGVWILGAVDDDEREIGMMGIVVEYAGKTGPAQWIAPVSQSWDYAVFSGASHEGTPGTMIPMVIDRVQSEAGEMERWSINGKSYDGSALTVLYSGSRYRLMFSNRSDDDHPLHFHRYSFELRSVNGKSVAGIVKDVAILRARGTLEAEFVPRELGLCLFHCHQQMHMDNGLKTLFEVR